jgi:hypothetical protein
LKSSVAFALVLVTGALWGSVSSTRAADNGPIGKPSDG